MPTLGIIRKTLALSFGQAGIAAFVFWLPLLPLFLTAAFFTLLAGGDVQPGEEVVSASSAVAAVMSWLAFPVALMAGGGRWFRWLLRGTMPGEPVPPVDGWIEAAGMLCLAYLGLTLFMGVVLNTFVAELGPVAGYLLSLTGQLTSVVLYRLSPVAVGAALSRPMDVRRAWDVTGGLTLPLLLAAVALQLAFDAVAWPLRGAQGMPALLLHWMLLPVAVVLNLTICAVVWGVAVEGRRLD